MNIHVIFVAPFLMETTLRFVAGAAGLPGVNLSLISQEGLEKLPPGLRSALAAHWRVDDALDPRQIVVAARALESKLGAAKRMIGALEQLQVPLAQARETLGISGLDVASAMNFRDKARMKDVFARRRYPAHVMCSPEVHRRPMHLPGKPGSHWWQNHPPAQVARAPTAWTHSRT
jgi:hypothetical protein